MAGAPGKDKQTGISAKAVMVIGSTRRADDNVDLSPFGILDP